MLQVEEHYSSLLEYNVTKGYEYKSAIVIPETEFKTDIAAKNYAWQALLGKWLNLVIDIENLMADSIY